MMKSRELLDARDDMLERVVAQADPMVLRGLVYQLTGDERLRETRTTMTMVAGSAFHTVAESDVSFVRKRAVELLAALRDAGPGEVPVGDPGRLHVSLNLTAGQEIPVAELGMCLDRAGVDPWAASLSWQQPPSQERLQSFKVLIIGAGMGGLGAAVPLKRAGIPFVVLEMANGVGGTWYWNRYPGARVDSPSRTYTHMFAADYVQPSEHCTQIENEKYFNWVADTFDVRRHIEFNTEVKSVVWDDRQKEWEITAEQPTGTRTWRANVVITAIGIFSRPNVPAFEGIERFKGQCFHTARWPEDLDLTGKRVAVIGSGCTAYQLMPKIVDETAHTYLFQRAPSWVFGMPGYLDLIGSDVGWLDRNFPHFTKWSRFRLSWVTYRPDVVNALFQADPNYPDPLAASEANRQIREECLAFMRTKFADRPDLMEKMIPAQLPGSHRPVVVDTQNSIYDVLLRDDVTLVVDPISQMSENGIVTQDGTEYDLDVIILATGFKANDFMWPIDIRGRGGLRLEELWSKDGPRAYLGAMVPGFPNFFMLYGPNMNSISSVLEIEEMVTRFALQCIAALILEKKDVVDVTENAYWRFNAVHDAADALRVYNSDKQTKGSYYRNDAYQRSVTQGALDIRLLWHWLRDPGDNPSLRGGPRLDEQFAEISPELARQSRAVAPYFYNDLTLA